ncbi:MAG: SGNH/GDSL hydrolase family protein [Firmicutes bacterium]|nr:SGNH/GDSL hydrolase family protein [Bacillota bacterium]
MKPKILFQGDSITDCNRLHTNSGLGDGYVYLVSKELTECEIINKGISGNRVSDLWKRWKKDTIQVNPDILTIFIGINDVWHKHAYGKRFSIEKFEETYRKLIDSSLENNPKLKIILMTPFYLPFGAYKKAWNKEFDLIMNTCHQISLDYQLPLIHLHEAFQTVSMNVNQTELLYDGVHPTLLGHQLIRDEWLNLYNSIVKS